MYCTSVIGILMIGPSSTQLVKSNVETACLFELLMTAVRGEAFFAVQMVHGYLSLPFFFFMVPLLRLTQTFQSLL